MALWGPSPSSGRPHCGGQHRPQWGHMPCLGWPSDGLQEAKGDFNSGPCLGMGMIVCLLYFLGVWIRCEEKRLAGIPSVPQQYTREFTCEDNMSSSQPQKYSDILHTAVVLKVLIDRGCLAHLVISADRLQRYERLWSHGPSQATTPQRCWSCSQHCRPSEIIKCDY